MKLGPSWDGLLEIWKAEEIRNGFKSVSSVDFRPGTMCQLTGDCLIEQQTKLNSKDRPSVLEEWVRRSRNVRFKPKDDAVQLSEA
jgi:hypothetical protein